MNTKCEKCIFAIVDEQQQTGCHFDIPNTITKQFPNIYSQSLIKTETGYFKIMDFVCPMALTEQGTKYLIDNGVRDEEIEDTMLSLTRNKYYLVYILDENLDNLRTNLEELTSSFCTPSYISFVKKHKTIKSKLYIDILNEFKLCPWKLHDIVDTKNNDGEIIDMILDTNIGQNKTVSLSIWYNKYYLSNTYYDRVNETMNYFYQKQAYVAPTTNQDFNGLFIPFSSYVNHYKKLNFTLQSLQEDIMVYKLKVL
jgi:hypothetical protein